MFRSFASLDRAAASSIAHDDGIHDMRGQPVGVSDIRIAGIESDGPDVPISKHEIAIR